MTSAGLLLTTGNGESEKYYQNIWMLWNIVQHIYIYSYNFFNLQEYYFLFIFEIGNNYIYIIFTFEKKGTIICLDISKISDDVISLVGEPISGSNELLFVISVRILTCGCCFSIVISKTINSVVKQYFAPSFSKRNCCLYSLFSRH